MEEGEIVGLRDLLKVKVIDGKGRHIGHVQDLAIGGVSSPGVAYLGTHIFWTEYIGDLELVRPVEDIVLLLPWSQVESFGEDSFHLVGTHPDFPVETAGGKVLLRADLLDKQMLDSKGTRIQRVDDVMMRVGCGGLEAVGLEVSRLLIGGSRLRRFVEGLKKKYGSPPEVAMVPLEAVERIDEDSLVVGAMLDEG